MIRIIIITIFCAGISFAQTKWSKCKIDDTKLRECLDGEVKKKEWRKWYIAYQCENEDSKHYYWVADKMISDDATTSPFSLGLSILGTILGTSAANHTENALDSSDEIIPLIEERKIYLDSLEEIQPRPLLTCAVLAGLAVGFYLLVISI